MPLIDLSGAGERQTGKNKMTDTTTPAKPEAAGGPSEAQAAGSKNPVPANPAMVEFPRDEYGTLSPLRQELLLAASRIRGNKEKHALFLATLETAAQHALARFQPDAAAIQSEADEEVARINRANAVGRVAGRAVA